MKQKIVILFACFFAVTTSYGAKRFFITHGNTIDHLGMGFHLSHAKHTYIIADVIYKLCNTKLTPLELTSFAAGTPIKGLCKAALVKGTLSIKYYKTAIALHLLFQNFTLLNDAIADKNNRTNLVPKMIIRTLLPLLVWCIQEMQKNCTCTF